MNELHRPLRMAARVPQHFLGSDSAVSGYPVEGSVLSPGSEVNHPPFSVWPLLSNMPVPPGIRSGEIRSSDEVAVPVQDSAIDQPTMLLPKIIVQPAKAQQPFYRYGVGGEALDYYQYEDLKGILGDGRLASGNYSDTSVSAISEKHVEIASLSSANSSVGEHPAGPRLKLMCSFGGKILPRPGDGKLRYVGGETRIVSVGRHITYSDLMRKMMQLYGQPVTMKYQLPDEDLDALISVSSDEDLENMMEEYDRLEAGEGNPRIRSFLFSSAEYDPGNVNDSTERRSTDLMFVDAINGLSESLSSKHLDSVSASTSNNSTGFKASEAWNAPRIPESVSVPVLASPAFQVTASPIMHSLPAGIASHNKPVLSRILSAPPPAPSSPPVFSQAAQIRQFPIPDISHHVSPDQPPIKVPVGHLYEMQRGDGTYHEVDGVGSATSSVNSQHDALEQRRMVDSPTKAQQETIFAHGNTLDQLHRPEPLRTADSGASRVDSQSTQPRPDSYGRMPKVGSHGKLIPLQQEQLVELGTPLLAGDNQFPNKNIHPPMDLQAFGAQPQLQVAQTAVQHPLETRREVYQRMDPMQQSASENMQAQQQALHQRQQIVSQAYPAVGGDPMQHAALERMHPQALPHFRQPIVFYPPMGLDQLQQSAPESQQQASRHLQQYVTQLYAPGGPSGQESESFTQAEQQDDALTGQLPFKSVALQNPVNPPRSGAVSIPVSQLAPAPLAPGLAFQGNNLKQGGGLQYFPVHGGLMDLPYGRITMQPNNEQANRVLKSPNIPLDSREQRYMEDQIARDQIPRPVIPPYPGASTYQEGLVHFTDHGISRRENKEHLQQHEDEEFAARLRYQGGVDWSMQKMYNESDKMMGGWTQTGQLDATKELAADTASSEIFGKSSANAAGLQTIESSFGAAAAGDTHLGAEKTGNQFDPIARASIVPVRVEGDGLPMLAIAQQGANTLDASSIPSREARHANPISLGTQQMSDDKAGGLGQSVHPGSLLVPPSNMLPSAILAKMEEGRWTEGFESDRLSVNNSGRHSNEGAFETSTTLPLDDGLKRPASNDMIESPEDLLSVVSKNCSNRSSADESAFVPPFSHMQTMVPNGTSYPIGLNTWGMGLDAFQTNIPVSPPTCTSAPDGLSTANPSFPLMVDAVTASSILAQAGKDSIYGQREELIEGAHTRADTFVDNTGLINAPSVVPFDSAQVSKGMEEKGLFPIFDSRAVREPETAECEDEDIKGDRDLELVANDVAASVLQPAPTLSIQNWEDTLANVETEAEVTKESLLIDESLDEVKFHVNEKVVTFQEIKTGSKDADKDGLVANKPTNVAVIAEEDAVAHGLQTIKNADLEELRELGSGTFGTVYHGKWRGTDVAIKRIKSSCFIGRPSERERLIADFWREAYILGQLHHPNVVAFYGVVRDGPGGTLATVTEYMVNGSLKQFLQKKDRTMDRRKRFSIIMDAAFGMEYLHGKNIVHFDLKCENLLVNMRDPQRPICKVGDLGLSKVKHQTMVSGGVRGTLPWMAPELLNGSSSLVSEKVDVFSFGIVMWELLTGDEPYANMHYGAIIGGIVNNTLRPAVPSYCDPSWKSLMERCWSAEPGERPSFSEIASELRAMASSAASKVQVQAPTAGSS